jgi:hypothetical protein
MKKRGRENRGKRDRRTKKRARGIRKSRYDLF